MCGIHFAICTARPVRPDDAVVQLLKSRGPDSFQQQEVIVNVRNDNCPSGEARQYHLSFSSSVLSLRGYHTAVQPFLDKETGSILCWNGEAWKIGDAKVSANDGEIVFNLLLRTAPSTARGRLSQDEVNSRIRNIIAAFDSIRGPYAFVHFDAPSGVVFFGRDCLGRRSLLTRTDAAGIVFISSVCTGTWEEGWHEIEADGIYAMDVSKCLSVQSALAGVCKSRNGVAGVQGPTTWHISRISQRPQNSDTTALVGGLPWA